MPDRSEKIADLPDDIAGRHGIESTERVEMHAGAESAVSRTSEDDRPGAGPELANRSGQMLQVVQRQRVGRLRPVDGDPPYGAVINDARLRHDVPAAATAWR